MAFQAPYVGSKVSLVSNLQIRYEGILYAVDPIESTIALSEVRCHGTEDRPSARPVAGRDDVFKYILFKSDDVKELTVSEIPSSKDEPPHDPAIVKLSQAQSNQLSSTDTDAIQRIECSEVNNALDGMQERRHDKDDAQEHSAKVRLADVDTNYDFDEANRKFNQLLNRDDDCEQHLEDGELLKEGENSATIGKVVGDRNKITVMQEHERCYSKGSSFFDKISYRKGGVSDIPAFVSNPNRERTRNEQTFGEAAMRSFEFRNRESHPGPGCRRTGHMPFQ